MVSPLREWSDFASWSSGESEMWDGICGTVCEWALVTALFFDRCPMFGFVV